MTFTVLARTRSLSPAIVLFATGLTLGALLMTASTPAPLRASGHDRAGESIVVTGTISKMSDGKQQTQFEQEAIYLLDYKTGRLLASVPSTRVSVTGSEILSPFVERDLVKDFRLSPGTTPHFLMTTATVAEGWMPLFVFETTTSKVASYRLVQQSVGTTARPRFELLEMRSFGRAGSPSAN